MILNFYNVISKKSVWNFCFLLFFSFLLFGWKWKYKKTWLLYVASNNGFLEFSSARTTKQNKEYTWMLWSSWICDILKVEIRDIYISVIRDLVVAMFLSVSFDLFFEYYKSYSSFVMNLHDGCFPRFVGCMMMYAFLNGSSCTRHIRLGKWKNVFSFILH